MIKLLGFWLAWRAIRAITAVAVVAGVLALLINGRPGDAAHSKAPLIQLGHATRPLEQQLEGTIERAFKR